MSDYQIDYLSARLEEVDSATDQLLFMIHNEDSCYYGGTFMQKHLSKLLFEGAAIRRKLAEARE